MLVNEFPTFLWGPTIRYFIHNIPPLHHVVSQLNSVYIPNAYM
jgi:hypothetical protein